MSRCESRNERPDRRCMLRTGHAGAHRFWAYGENTFDNLEWGGPPPEHTCREPLRLLK